MDDPKDPLAEVRAMEKVAEAFQKLDPSAVRRVLRWAADHWGAGDASVLKPREARGEDPAPNGSDAAPAQFTDLGELFAAVSPSSDADKVLAVGYWQQFIEGQTELSSYEVNSALKHLGHGVRNVTSAFDNLKARKPAPVIQLKKSGTSKQARKTYKLTLAGKQAVEAAMPRQ